MGTDMVTGKKRDEGEKVESDGQIKGNSSNLEEAEEQHRLAVTGRSARVRVYRCL